MSNKLENMLELAKELHNVDAAPESLVNDLERKVRARNINKKIKVIPMMSGAQIKQLRAQYGMSQATLALVLGMSKESVSKWEREEKKPSGPALRMLHLIEQRGPEILII
ncbi:helix-turn-helix domain-containing protein [Providencia huaxiensis]|uniref:Helix-turn-helix domain-containing protein n=1 Tax=Providencia huaxiensis TaxID=2027290 RepID=A0ABU2J1U8_9GAMM|nr:MULTISPECIES: helix-turn-helix domain-containing protein [Providencia]MBZ3681803.1 helix-turn-helix domain-containing protein [Providencia rettgeri]AXH63790.1 helix-turn-helix domain-containing protein [Providencia huaxiensis]MBN6361162.1 helix-turn-helix domain-containing protein [Providencia huaxiensis]MCD2527742.1 helix-turn-helix domain-containing protein [Providencia huaxiensis]MDT0135296.1 helix-turn-helix domain-containing protein [Providencia huaxiensis]